MSRASILTAMYTQGNTMSLVGGYNFDWVGAKSDGNGTNLGHCTFHIAFGRETNEDDIGGGGSWEYIDRVDVLVIGLRMGDEYTSIDNLHYDYELIRSKMFDDIKKCFSDTQNGIGDAGGCQLIYKGDSSVDEDSEDVCSVEVRLNFELLYRTER